MSPVSASFRRLSVCVLTLAWLAGGPDPALAAVAPCGKLCGSWTLLSAESSDVAAVIADAVAGYKEEKIRTVRHRSADLAAMAQAELEESLGPLRLRPQRDELHKQLTQQLVIPEHLNVRLVDAVVVLDEQRSSPRRFEAGEPYSRVDSIGTAKITIRRQADELLVNEDYGRSRSNRELYKVAPKGERLVVTRTIERPGLKTLVIRSVYAADVAAP
jgi:hypothetical protein